MKSDLELTSGYISTVKRNQQTTQLNNGLTCRIGWTSEARRDRWKNISLAPTG